MIFSCTMPRMSRASDVLHSGSSLSIDEALALAKGTFDDSVVLLRWPEHEDQRRELADGEVPRLLLLEADTPPPRSRDLLEDWVRAPIDRDELLARRAELARRATCADHRPVLDDDGLLWWHDRWVAVPAAQVPVARVLVERAGELVRLDELADAYTASGGSPDPVAVKAMLGRLVKRCAEVGVSVRSIRGRGYVLDAPNPCYLHRSAAAEAKDLER
jgi:hypothetical protein